MKVSEGRNLTAEPFSERWVKEISDHCFLAETERIKEIGREFVRYFAVHASSDGVLFKTIKEITADMKIPHQSLTKALKILEEHKVIYRRNGIIGLWKV